MKEIRAKVALRNTNPHNGADLKPESLQLQGKEFTFMYGGEMTGEDPYPGEIAYIPNPEQEYPSDAPVWIASGDLEIL